MNALAKRDVAIVTDQAGTTRDVLDVSLDLDGYKVIFSDTAGLRETVDQVEAEGIRRANRAADESDLVLWLYEAGTRCEITYQGTTPVLQVATKVDVSDDVVDGISVITGHGLKGLLDEVIQRVKTGLTGTDSVLITRQRYRTALVEALRCMDEALYNEGFKDEFRAENLRLAGEYIGRVTGRIDVEDLLDVIFSEFCVGK